MLLCTILLRCFEHCRLHNRNSLEAKYTYTFIVMQTTHCTTKLKQSRRYRDVDVKLIYPHYTRVLA